MSSSVKTVVVYGFLLSLEKEQVKFLDEETALNVFPVTYRADEDTDRYLVGELVATTSNVEETSVCDIDGLSAIESQIVQILKDMAIVINKKAQVIVTSYYW